MSWVYASWSSLIEPILLVLILGFLVKTLVSNSRKVDVFTDQMCKATILAQAYLSRVEDALQGMKTEEEAIREAKLSLPEEFQNNGCHLFNLKKQISNGGGESDAQDAFCLSAPDAESTRSKRFDDPQQTDQLNPCSSTEEEYVAAEESNTAFPDKPVAQVEA